MAKYEVLFDVEFVTPPVNDIRVVKNLRYIVEDDTLHEAACSAFWAAVALRQKFPAIYGNASFVQRSVKEIS